MMKFLIKEGDTIALVVFIFSIFGFGIFMFGDNIAEKKRNKVELDSLNRVKLELEIKNLQQLEVKEND